MNLKNSTNLYVDSLPIDIFDRIPKSVWAAIAISCLTCGGDQLSQAQKRIMEEWSVLFDNGIVPQKPIKLTKLDKKYIELNQRRNERE